jgi:hypothetical protein
MIFHGLLSIGPTKFITVSYDFNHIALTTLIDGCRLSSEGWFCPGFTED